MQSNEPSTRLIQKKFYNVVADGFILSSQSTGGAAGSILVTHQEKICEFGRNLTVQLLENFWHIFESQDCKVKMQGNGCIELYPPFYSLRCDPP